MRESNSRDWSHNQVPKPFGQSRHKTSGAGRVNRTLVGEVQTLCTAIVLNQQTLEVAGRIALPIVCFAGRCLAVLATPPHNMERKAGLEPALTTLATSGLGH